MQSEFASHCISGSVCAATLRVATTRLGADTSIGSLRAWSGLRQSSLMMATNIMESTQEIGARTILGSSPLSSTLSALSPDVKISEKLEGQRCLVFALFIFISLLYSLSCPRLCLSVLLHCLLSAVFLCCYSLASLSISVYLSPCPS